MKIKGRDLVSGLPKSITIDSNEIYLSLKNNIKKIIEATKSVLENTPPELAADIYKNGIVLTGGGALLDGIDILFSHELAVSTRISDSPLTSVVSGTGVLLDNLRLLEK